MLLDFNSRELTVKLVYSGPALSGKTTNLQALHRVAAQRVSGRLMTLDTKDDRTLFFDLLPITIDTPSGLRIRIKLFTVPGQVIHNATRRLVLQGADGVAFVADSQVRETQANRNAFLNMQENLRENGIDPLMVPLVIQFNKRDLPEIRSETEIQAMASRGKEPIFLAVATRGVGVFETFQGLLGLTWRRLDQEHDLHTHFGVSAATVNETVARAFPLASPVAGS